MTVSHKSAVALHRQALSFPIRKACVQAERPVSGSSQEFESLIGKYAIRAAAIGHYELPLRDFFHPRANFGERNRTCARNMPSGVLFGRTDINYDGAALAYPLLQFRAGHWLHTSAILQKCLDQSPDFSQTRFRDTSHRKPQAEHRCVSQPVSDVIPVSPAVHKLSLAQDLKVLRCICHRLAGFYGKVFHRTFSLGKEFEDFQAAAVRERLADAGELLEQFILKKSFVGRPHIQIFNRIIE
jgi:hypothetical protein